MAKSNGYFIDLEALPNMFPTHKHEPKFWESLGRVVATFGFLEEILGKALFALTATKPYSEEEVQKAIYELICDVVETVTSMGFQFPDSQGPGAVIWN